MIVYRTLHLGMEENHDCTYFYKAKTTDRAWVREFRNLTLLECSLLDSADYLYTFHVDNLCMEEKMQAYILWCGSVHVYNNQLPPLIAWGGWTQFLGL